MKWVVAYDIHCDRSRSRLSKRLEQVGFRRQFSVFEGELSVDEARLLLTELEQHLTSPNDVLTAWPSTENEHARIVHKGHEREQTERDWMVI